MLPRPRPSLTLSPAQATASLRPRLTLSSMLRCVSVAASHHRPRPSLSLTLLAVACLSACASTPSVSPERPTAFVSRPAREPGCAFEVFEQREPPRPYALLGVVPLTANEFLGQKGRKALLQATACQSGADAVLLPHPAERMVAGGRRVREYEARFLTWTDVPARVADEDLPPFQVRTGPAPTAEEGYVIVPVGPEWPGDTIGIAEHTRKPGEGASTESSEPAPETRSPASR